MTPIGPLLCYNNRVELPNNGHVLLVCCQCGSYRVVTGHSNFDAWRKRFNGWVDQQKLRVNDLFRRFDSNHDGMLTREFMKGLKASGEVNVNTSGSTSHVHQSISNNIPYIFPHTCIIFLRSLCTESR